MVEFNTVEKLDSSQQKYKTDIFMEFMDVQKAGEVCFFIFGLIFLLLGYFMYV